MGFFELNLGVSGLYASQKGLAVSGNNISNASTKGYSRQEVTLKADRPLSGFGTGMIGTGVQATSVERVRDAYLDSKLWTQNAKLGEYNIKTTQYSLIETVYGEPSEKGFTNVYNQLFTAIDELVKNPSGKDQKMTLRQQALNFTKYYNNISTSLERYQSDVNYEIKSRVEEVNQLATQIQNLNEQIFNAEIYGDEASSFRDERDLCIDRLSQICDTTVTEEEMVIGEHTYTKCKVIVGGQVLVDHNHITTLELVVRGDFEEEIDKSVAEIEALYYKANNGGLTSEEEDTLESMKKSLKRMSSGIQIIDDVPGEITINYSKDGETKQLLKVDSADHGMMQSAGDGKLNAVDRDALYDIVWSDGKRFNVTDYSGELRGLIDMRDGCGINGKVNYNGIPYYLDRMNNYVRTFARTMNEEYSKNADGYIQVKEFPTRNGKTVNHMQRVDDGYKYYFKDAAGDYHEITGLTEEEENQVQVKEYLFSYTEDEKNPVVNPDFSNQYEKMTAANFTISEKLFNNPTEIRTTFDGDEESGTKFMANLHAQKDNKGMFKEGDPKDYMVSIFSELGIGSQEADMYLNTQTAVTNNIINQRLSVSQVDISQEFTSLIKFQQAYQGAAKFISTMDDVYNTTIFKLGSF